MLREPGNFQRARRACQRRDIITYIRASLALTGFSADINSSAGTYVRRTAAMSCGSLPAETEREEKGSTYLAGENPVLVVRALLSATCMHISNPWHCCFRR